MFLSKQNSLRGDHADQRCITERDDPVERVQTLVAPPSTDAEVTFDHIQEVACIGKMQASTLFNRYCMNKNFNTVTSGHDEWLTPKYITDSLGPFDLDPCSPGNRRPWDTAKKHLDESDNGLVSDWEGRVWCNPPYGRETFKWLSKLAKHGNGIALIFARTETKGFHSEVWGKADAVFFFKGRLRFCYVDGTEADVANAPSCLIAYGSNNVKAIIDCGFDGKMVVLK